MARQRDSVIKVGGWYANLDKPSVPPRHVLHRSATHVLYGTGSESHRECLIETFARWIARNHCTLQNNTRT